MKKHCGQKKLEISHASQVLTHEPQILVLSQLCNYYCNYIHNFYSILAQCNGIQDCFGGDDEQFCPTFNCNNGTALAYSQKCDGFPDCPDGEDEDDCLGMYFVAK